MSTQTIIVTVLVVIFFFFMSVYMLVKIRDSLKDIAYELEVLNKNIKGYVNRDTKEDIKLNKYNEHIMEDKEKILK